MEDKILVVMKVSQVGVNFSRAPGDEVLVSVGEANRLIRAGAAELGEGCVVVPMETADLIAPETAEFPPPVVSLSAVLVKPSGGLGTGSAASLTRRGGRRNAVRKRA